MDFFFFCCSATDLFAFIHSLPFFPFLLFALLSVHFIFNLDRCKMRQRDSRLFYLSMEVMVRKAGVKTVIALDDDARPAILQACHPKGDSRYVSYMNE